MHLAGQFPEAGKLLRGEPRLLGGSVTLPGSDGKLVEPAGNWGRRGKVGEVENGDRFGVKGGMGRVHLAMDHTLL